MSRLKAVVHIYCYERFSTSIYYSSHVKENDTRRWLNHAGRGYIKSKDIVKQFSPFIIESLTRYLPSPTSLVSGRFLWETREPRSVEYKSKAHESIARSTCSTLTSDQNRSSEDTEANSARVNVYTSGHYRPRKWQPKLTRKESLLAIAALLCSERSRRYNSRLPYILFNFFELHLERNHEWHTPLSWLRAWRMQTRNY